MAAITTSAAAAITPPTMAPTGALLDLDDDAIEVAGTEKLDD
jgi:hypothetical protein